jgi:hypothetical protein
VRGYSRRVDLTVGKTRIGWKCGGIKIVYGWGDGVSLGTSLSGPVY